jgi:hypothetical protein
MFSVRAVGSRFNLHNNFYKKLSVILLILLLAVITFVTMSYLTAPSYHLSSPQPVSHTTSLFPTNNVVYVNDNSTTNIIVNITGSSLPDDSYFTIITTNYGTDVPQDAGAPLAVEGATVAGYYDVKVTTNITLSPDVIAKVTITNLNFNEHTTTYYYNTTQGKWISVSTEFQSPHTLVGTFAAIALTGTPIAGTGTNDNSPSPSSSPSPSFLPSFDPSPSPSPSPTTSPLPSPPFSAPEYGVGTLLALFAFFAAFALFKIRGKHTDKTASTPHIKT